MRKGWSFLSCKPLSLDPLRDNIPKWKQTVVDHCTTVQQFIRLIAAFKTVKNSSTLVFLCFYSDDLYAGFITVCCTVYIKNDGHRHVAQFYKGLKKWEKIVVVLIRIFHFYPQVLHCRCFPRRNTFWEGSVYIPVSLWQLSKKWFCMMRHLWVRCKWFCQLDTSLENHVNNRILIK